MKIMSYTLSIFILNYNPALLFCKCVDSLLLCLVDIEITYVDKARSDASLDGL